MSLDAETRTQMLKAIPHLRAFALSLCRNADRADDFVQETLTRGIAHIDSFRPGTNLQAWLFAILRNAFYSEWRRRKWWEEGVSNKRAEALVAVPQQAGWDIAEDLHDAMEQLSPQHREALTLIGSAGLSYEEAAAIANCEVGTMKSRVNRARIRLALLMSGDKGVGPRRVNRRDIDHVPHRLVAR